MSVAKEIDCEFTNMPVCPYCGYEWDDDCEMNESSSAECPECLKKFRYEVEYSKSFSSRQVPCMNGGEHVWRHSPSPGFPDYKYCPKCDTRVLGKQGDDL